MRGCFIPDRTRAPPGRRTRCGRLSNWSSRHGGAVEGVGGRSPRNFCSAPQRSCSRPSKSGMSLRTRSRDAATHRFHHRLPGHDEAGGLLLRGDGPPDQGRQPRGLGRHPASARVELAFMRVDDYRAPQWPDSEHPKQFHLDFEVDEIEPEQRRVSTSARRCSRTPSAPTATAGGLHRPDRPPLLPVPQQGRHLDRPGPDLAQARLRMLFGGMRSADHAQLHQVHTLHTE